MKYSLTLILLEIFCYTGICFDILVEDRIVRANGLKKVVLKYFKEINFREN